MVTVRRLALYGSEPMQRWGREFDRLEEKWKMGKRVDSAINNILTGANRGKPNGVINSHVLPNTFIKNYYAPQKHIYSKSASATGGWKRMPIKKVVTRPNFYSIADSDGVDSISLERLFSSIESHVPSWLRSEGISTTNRGVNEYWLSWFIIAQAHRTPYAAEIRSQSDEPSEARMPAGVLVARNLMEAKEMARKIFSWHWQIWELDHFQTREEVLLGESCVFRLLDKEGFICNLRKQTVLICSSEIGTQCEAMVPTSKSHELKMIHGLNEATLTSNAAHNGHVYRSTMPIA